MRETETTKLHTKYHACYANHHPSFVHDSPAIRPATTKVHMTPVPSLTYNAPVQSCMTHEASAITHTPSMTRKPPSQPLPTHDAPVITYASRMIHQPTEWGGMNTTRSPNPNTLLLLHNKIIKLSPPQSPLPMPSLSLFQQHFQKLKKPELKLKPKRINEGPWEYRLTWTRGCIGLNHQWQRQMKLRTYVHR